MEIQGTSHSGPERARRAYEERQRALIDANRSLVRSARDELSTGAREALERSREARDEVTLSPEALAANQDTPADREARVRALAEEHRMQRLHTPERIERAAQRLLGG